MPDNHDEIKTKLTALAQLVALLGECKGLTETAELAEATGYSDRAIRKAKAELGCRNYGSGGTRVPELECRTAPGCRNSGAAPRARAYKESPTEIVISSKLASNARACEREIAGLNGSTPIFVDRLASIMADPMLGQMPDYELAHRLIETNVATYDAAKVKVGISELEAHVADKGRPRNWAKAFTGFVKQASPEARPPKTHDASGRVTTSEWDRVMAEMQASGAA